MSFGKHNKHLNFLNVSLFFLTMLSGMAGSFFPDASEAQITLWQIAGAAFIAGCIVSGARVIREGWDLPGAGFTMLAIAYGVYFSAIEAPTDSQLPLIASGVYMLIAAMFLISYYRPFPLWVRAFGLVACIPFSIILVLHHLDIKQTIINKSLFALSFPLIDFTGVLWGIYFYRNNRKQEKSKSGK